MKTYTFTPMNNWGKGYTVTTSSKEKAVELVTAYIKEDRSIWFSNVAVTITVSSHGRSCNGTATIDVSGLRRDKTPFIDNGLFHFEEQETEKVFETFSE